MNKLNLFAMFIATLFLCGCAREKPISFVDENFYLVSMDGIESKYVQIQCQFGKSDVKIFKIKNLDVMVGDVAIGQYSLIDDVLKLPTIGSFHIKQIVEEHNVKGYHLYSDDKLKYRLTKKQEHFITDRSHRSLSASIIK